MTSEELRLSKALCRILKGGYADEDHAKAICADALKGCDVVGCEGEEWVESVKEEIKKGVVEQELFHGLPNGGAREEEPTEKRPRTSFKTLLKRILQYIYLMVAIYVAAPYLAYKALYDYSE